MAIYHLEAKVISRGAGRSACAASAYLSCSKIYNEYDGVQHDYTRKQGLIWEQVFLPEYAPKEWQERSKLWNAVEENEKTKDSRLAREFIVALPIELSKNEWQTLLTDYINEQFVSDGMCADVAIHDTDGHNPHAHIMLTVRPLNPNGTWQYKTEKEYICIRNGEEKGFTAAEFKQLKEDGWEKQYQYLIDKKKVYMAPSKAEAQGLERLSKHPKSTKYGKQNPITQRWNCEEQLVLWREAWAKYVNLSLEKNGFDERIDHRNHVERGIEEQPTIHEGVVAQALERKGIVSDRCEINRQIKRDNSLLRELKAQVNKLLQTVKNTVPALAEAMETVREKMIIFRYQLRHIMTGKYRMNKGLNVIKPEFERYMNIAEKIKVKSRSRKSLLAKKKETPIIYIVKHRELSRKIAELTEELEELRSEKKRLLVSLGYAENTGLSEFKNSISAIETNLKKLEKQEQKYNAELESALNEYKQLQEQAEELNPDELISARLDIRPEKEQSAVSRVQNAYGNRYDPLLMYDAKRDVAQMLKEENPRSVLERLRQKDMDKEALQKPPIKKTHERDWER